MDALAHLACTLTRSGNTRNVFEYLTYQNPAVYPIQNEHFNLRWAAGFFVEPLATP